MDWGALWSVGQGMELSHLVSTGNYLEALRQAGPVARDPARPAAERVQAALAASRAAYYLSDYAAAREYALLARAQARDAETRAQALHYLGAALAYYDPAEAEGVLFEALSMDTTYTATHKAAMLSSLGRAYEVCRNHLAVTVYQQAADAYLDQGRPARAAAALRNAAWLALLAGDLDTARGLLDRSQDLLTQEDRNIQANHMALRAYLAMRSGQYQEAVTLAEELLHPARRDTTPWSRCLAALVGAQVALEQERPDLAEVLVAHAERLLPTAECTKLANLLTRVRRVLKEKQGGEDE